MRLSALYRLQVNSADAAAYFAAMPGPLEVTTLLLYEFRQAVRFQIRLHRHDASKGYPKAEGTKMLADLPQQFTAKPPSSPLASTASMQPAPRLRHRDIREVTHPLPPTPPPA